MADLTFNYDDPEIQYASHRVPDPCIASYINEALGDTRSLINVGAGAGSYEPSDRYVVAVEPLSVMRAQRSAQRKVPAIIGKADTLPFDDSTFDAALATLTIHHWPDIAKGLQELHRVSNDRILILTFDPNAMDIFWGFNYFGEMLEAERLKFPTMDFITRVLGDHCEVKTIPIPLDCTDGFIEAFYGRPEAFLNPSVRKAQSAWGFLSSGVEEQLVTRLQQALDSGEWDRKYGYLRNQPEFTGSLRLVIARKPRAKSLFAH
ncbi:methyltransferase domain-containing protein [Olivibacter ginsenosidimutans]|uniref:Methyltransferase domain-containing protein n=1 Tax=Olivibacter ginsenosidimutans TaxID=1176537 RepID=A0ABP9C844_9SPHI